MNKSQKDYVLHKVETALKNEVLSSANNVKIERDDERIDCFPISGDVELSFDVEELERLFDHIPIWTKLNDNAEDIDSPFVGIIGFVEDVFILIRIFTEIPDNLGRLHSHV